MEIIIKTTWFPFGTYDAMALWPFIFVKGDVSETVIRHERIRNEQQKELLLVGFYLLYVVFFVFLFAKSFICRFDMSVSECWDYAYRNIPFENEAYKNQYNASYLEERKNFSWVKYIT